MATTGNSSTENIVSIVALCYNNEKKITETLDSIASQQYPAVELIIVDDRSTDNSAEVIKNWMSKATGTDCKFIQHEVNKGICAAINSALTASKGKYFGIIGDDIMFPDKLKDDVLFLEANPEYGFCHSNCVIFNEVTGEQSALKKSRHSKNVFDDYFSCKMTIATPTILYNKKVFEKVGLFDESLAFEDYDMILRVSYHFKVGYRDKTSVKYRITGKSMRSAKIDMMEKSIFKVLDKWKFLDNYKYYLSRVHLGQFCNYATRYKMKALKYIPRSMRFLNSRLFYEAWYLLVFKWNFKKPV